MTFTKNTAVMKQMLHDSLMGEVIAGMYSCMDDDPYEPKKPKYVSFTIDLVGRPSAHEAYSEKYASIEAGEISRMWLK